MKCTSNIIKGLLGLFLGWIMLAVGSQAFAQGGTWDTTKASMPTPRPAQAIGVIDGKLYAPGIDFTLGQSVLDVYDPVVDEWVRITPSPTRRSGNAAGVIDGKLYVVGGCPNGWCSSPTNMLEEYDPAMGTWVTRTPMPTARGSVAAAVLDGKLHVVGGNVSCGACTPLTTHEVYDPDNDTWATELSMLVAVNVPKAVAFGGKLYVVGGQDNTNNTTGILQVYDPIAKTWDTSSAPMPTDRVDPAVGVIHGKLYAVGGLSTSFGNIEVNTLEEYDPAMDTWVTRTPMPTARYYIDAGVIDGKLYVAGGGATTGALGMLEVYTPPPDFDGAINLIDDLDLYPSTTDTLVQKLQEAKDKFTLGDLHDARNKVCAFVGELEAAVDAGNLTTKEANVLLKKAGAILGEITFP